MKQHSRNSKTRKSSAKKSPRLRQLGGNKDEQTWLLVFAALILAVVLSVALVVAMKYNLTPDGDNKDSSKQDSASLTDPAEREDRIREILASIKLDETFEQVSEDIFGEKRKYSYDQGRTFSSSREYKRDANVHDTREVVRTAIEAAGYEFFDEPYAGSAAVQYHYKTDRGEYIRLSVMSENLFGPIDDSQPLTEEQRYAAPSIVTIKVNLDDNNE